MSTQVRWAGLPAVSGAARTMRVASMLMVCVAVPAAAVDASGVGSDRGVAVEAASGSRAAVTADPWPPGEGSEIARRACHDCHDPIVITASRLTAAQWSARVDAMLAKGAKVDDDEIDVLIDYLATHFGPP